MPFCLQTISQFRSFVISQFCTFAQQRYETKKQQKYETTEVRDNEYTKQRKYETTKIRNNIESLRVSREETYVVSLNLNTRAGFEPAITECPSKFKN